MFEMISLFKIYVYTEKAFEKMKNVCQKSIFYEAVYLDTFGLHSKWRPANKPNKKRFRVYSKNYGNIVSLRKTISRTARYRDDPYGNVINLSKHSFIKKQFEVLKKNLNFCPTPGYYNKKEIKTDIKNFERKIKLKSFFELKNQNKLNKNNSVSSDIPNIKPKSTQEPLKSHQTINAFI